MSARRRFSSAGAAGALIGALLFAWMLTGGTWRLFEWHQAADFYDAQAESLLDGHLDVPLSVLGIEAFESDGRTYMYQGLFPALLRLPVAAATDDLDGRLSALSMLAAYVVAAAATTSVAWQVRRLVGGNDPAGRMELLAVAGFVFSATAGSAVLAVGSQVTVYHESAMWGLATGLVTLALLLRHLVAPGRWTLAAASAAAAACLWSRASIGLGMAIALAFVALGELGAWWRARRGREPWQLVAPLGSRRSPSGRAAVAAIAATVLPLVLYTGLNVLKFGTLSSVPWDRQTFLEVSDDRREFLDAHDGTFFDLEFLPSTAVAYLRPDAVRLDDRFPWVGFRTDDIGRRRLVGGVLFDRVDATGSVPVAFPALLVLGVVGFVALVRRRSELSPLWSPVLGAAAAAGSIFVFGFIALRYLADVVPLLVLLGAAGLATLRLAGRRWRPLRRKAVGAGLGLLVVAGAWVNLGHGIWYQGVYASPADEDVTTRFFERRRAWPTAGAGDSSAVAVDDTLPVRGRAGDLHVVGDCDGLYVSDGAAVDHLSHTNWKPIARTPAVGYHDLDVRFGRRRAGTTEPLLVQGDSVLGIEHLGDDRVRFTFHGAGIAGGQAFAIDPDRRYRVRASLDPHTDVALVVVDERMRFGGGYYADGVPKLDRDFGRDLRERPVSRALCRDLLSESAAARTGTGTRTATG